MNAQKHSAVEGLLAQKLQDFWEKSSFYTSVNDIIIVLKFIVWENHTHNNSI